MSEMWSVCEGLWDGRGPRLIVGETSELFRYYTALQPPRVCHPDFWFVTPMMMNFRASVASAAELNAVPVENYSIYCVSCLDFYSPRSACILAHVYISLSAGFCSIITL